MKKLGIVACLLFLGALLLWRFQFSVKAQTVSEAIYVGSGTASLGTSALGSAHCTGDVGQPADVSVTATGVTTADVLTAGFNGKPTAVTGFIPSTSGMLTVIPYPSADHVNFTVCNNTSGSITPGAITVNWTVIR